MSIKKTISLLSSSQKGAANGVAELSTSGTVPTSQLPSYVDDVIEGTMNSKESVFTDTKGNTVNPENGKIYVDTNTNKSYRWGGTKYIVIAADLALGETSSTAYAGNKGKALADKIGTNDISSIAPTVTEAVTNLNTDKLNKTGDSKDNTATFTSSDVEDGSSTAWTSVPALTSGEKHTSMFSKMSQMFKNIRYLYKMLGTTDISAIGDGTATGAISSLNSNLETNTELTGKQYNFGWKESAGWYRIAELFSNRDADSILMEFNFMPSWGHGSTSSIKVEVGWFNRTKVILENTKNILNSYNELQYDGIRIYKSNDKTDTIYIDLHVPRANHIIFSVCQYTTNYKVAYATILNPCIYMNNEELDASAYTLLKQININETSDTYTSTLSRISTLESKVSALENN